MGPLGFSHDSPAIVDECGCENRNNCDIRAVEKLNRYSPRSVMCDIKGRSKRGLVEIHRAVGIGPFCHCAHGAWKPTWSPSVLI